MSVEKLTPSDFMRRLRPELYYDTSNRTTYLLDTTTLEYSLQLCYGFGATGGPVHE
jgi:hypothetical protein